MSRKGLADKALTPGPSPAGRGEKDERENKREKPGEPAEE